jgi:ComEC/Rec2-related protein
MITRSQLISYCYFYIVGLVAAMIAPLDAAHLPWLNALSIAGLVGLALGLFHVNRVRLSADPQAVDRAVRVAWALLLASSITLGYARYLSANTVPDARLGEVRLSAAGAVFEAGNPLPDTSRIRMHKVEPLEQDLEIRVVGDLDARVPVRDESGRATLDERARWQFRLAPLGVTSDVVRVRAADPIGTTYVVPQPFTRITSVQVVRGPASGRVALYRISNHIGSFSAAGVQSPVTILGRISADPLVYDFKTVLPITPEFIQFPAGGPFFRVEGGDLHVTVRPEMSNYTTFARTEALGYDVEFAGEMTVARGAANPGGFNARRFMQNYNIFGLMTLFPPREGPPPIHVIGPGGGEPRHGNALVEFSLDLRDRITRVIKATVLYPHSAFVGGVTLGLRYGLQGTQCMFSDRYTHTLHLPGKPTAVGHTCEETIADEFKEAGVNHVLAVSGLHVTIINVMFVGIFSMLRVPRKAYVPLIMMALVIFAIITGARPSTLRAVIMNSLFMLTWAYLDQSLRSSVLLGVPVAAFLILIHNPLVVVDPSFTLSFGAILSLGLLTTPSLDLLQRLKGNQFVLAAALAVGWTVLAVKHWALVVTPQFLLPAIPLVLVLFKLAGRLQQKGWGIPTRYNYTIIPEGIGAFFAAQFAIQLGMMIPLSAFYFCRWPFAGAYANLIAIPLIGVNVQLGAIGGLLGLIPGVGPYIALLLGAANWIFCSIFLWLAHASAEWFPYPFVRRPGVLFIAAYYLLCAWFIWSRPIGARLQACCGRFGLGERRGPVVVTLAGLLVLVGLLVVDLRAPPRGELRISVLSVGYGSALLVESPGGQRILVDAGYVEHERGRRNEAIRTVVPFLANSSIRHLDGFILTSARPERAAGASHVLEHLWVDHFFTPPTLTNLVAGESFDQFASRFDDAIEALDPTTLTTAYQELIGNSTWPRRPALAQALARRGPSFVNRWAGWHTQAGSLQAGQVLFAEQGPGGAFRIEVLNPVAGSVQERNFDNGSLVLRIVYGDFAMLLTGDLQHDGVAVLAARYPAEALKADVMTLPHRGAALGDAGGEFKMVLRSALERELGALLAKVQPERVVAEWGNPRPVLGLVSRDAVNAFELTRQFVVDRLGPDRWLSTDHDLAILLTSDGTSYRITTQAEVNRAAGGTEDAVADIAVGL